MNWALIRNTVHRLLTRPLAAAIVIAYGLYSLVMVFAHSMSPPSVAQPMNVDLEWISSAKAAWFLVWAIGSGLLGQERSDGNLPLLLSRPISRASYVLSRWAGLVLSVLAIDGVLVTLGLLWLLGHGTAPPLEAILIRWAWMFFFVLSTSAWLTLLSACFGGHGDFSVLVVASLCSYFLGLYFLGAQGIGPVHRILTQCWAPGEATFNYFSAGDQASGLFSGVLFAVAAATCLALAAYIMQRRNISYVNR